MDQEESRTKVLETEYLLSISKILLPEVLVDYFELHLQEIKAEDIHLLIAVTNFN